MENSETETIILDSSPEKPDLSFKKTFEDEITIIEEDNKSENADELMDEVSLIDEQHKSGSTILEDLCATSSLSNPSIHAEKTVEKVDFFNLDSSNSDEEQQLVENKVNDLLSSAAILNDIESGPSEYTTQNNLPKPGSFCKKRKLKSSLNSVSKEESSGHKNACLKHLKPSYNYKDIAELDPGDKNKQDPYPLMYRRDDRIPSGCETSVHYVPKTNFKEYEAHDGAIMDLNWCIARYSHLLLSASSDSSLKVWDIYQNRHVQYFKHNNGLKSACWTLDGETIVTGGYGCQAHVYDVLSGQNYTSYDVFGPISRIIMHPVIEDVFLVGLENSILAFDLRVDSCLPIREFVSNSGEVLDLAFLNENEIVSSNNIVSRDSADRTIMVWHFGSGAILSNQIYLERYTCPSLKVHPLDNSFVAQSNGDYIAVFSSQRPYKIKNKIFNKHKVSGYGIECDISPDGRLLATGDSDGKVFFYDYFKTDMLKEITLQNNVPTNRIKWHPVLTSTVAVSTWNGYLHILN